MWLEVLTTVLIVLAAGPLLVGVITLVIRRDPPVWTWPLAGLLALGGTAVLAWSTGETFWTQLGPLLLGVSWGTAALAWGVAAGLQPGSPTARRWGRLAVPCAILVLGSGVPVLISNDASNPWMLLLFAPGQLAGLPVAWRVGLRTDRVWRWATLLAALAGCTLLTQRASLHLGSWTFAPNEHLGHPVHHANLVATLGLLAVHAWWTTRQGVSSSERRHLGTALVAGLVALTAPVLFEDLVWARDVAVHRVAPEEPPLRLLTLSGDELAARAQRGIDVELCVRQQGCLLGSAETPFAELMAAAPADTRDLSFAVPSGRRWPLSHEYYSLPLPRWTPDRGLFVRAGADGGLLLPDGTELPITEASVPLLVRAFQGTPHQVVVLDPRGRWRVQQLVQLCVTLAVQTGRTRCTVPQ